MITQLQKFIRAEFHGIEMPYSMAGKIFFVILIVLGISLRTAGLDWGLSYTVAKGSPHHDEAHKVGAIMTSWDSFKEDFGEFEIARPVYLLRFFTRPLIIQAEKLGWNDPKNLVFETVAPRAINSFFGIAALPLIYALGTKLSGSTVGLFSLALLTFLPGHWLYSQITKFDLAVGTFNILLLLASIGIYERASTFWYVTAGVTAGLAAAGKASGLVIIPILILACGLRLWVARQEWRTVLKKTLALGIASSSVFLLLYPYPYINFQRWYLLLTAPAVITSSLLPQPSINLSLTPATFITTWQNYNKPDRPLMELAFSQPLRILFLPASAFLAILLILAWKSNRGIPYTLTALSVLMIYHSLSFFPPFGERYLLPLVPFVVILVALLVGLPAPFLSVPRSLRWALRTVGAAALCYEVALTWTVLPVFALQKDIRLQVTDFLYDQVKPQEAVGEFETGGRQSLPLDQTVITTMEMSSGGENPHLLPVHPEYVVFFVEPTNYDDAIRHQLIAPAIKHEFFDVFLKDYVFVKRFGHELTLFSRGLPRTLFTPVYDVYKKK